MKNKNLGTRHRAGIGITEVSDAISIIVSEERKIISVSRR
ncbi:MAG: DNA integrity scanning protein DisA nucleotide-binding domain protein [Ignavibacteria bacterium]|nr:DNA integrity scanning protein DisA nucleotide-binding domain protein [Ignavibacteria bacterium]